MTAGPIKGSLTIVGLGPGDMGWLAPEAREALLAATDLVGYQTYLDMVPAEAPGHRHGSDNRVELERARAALALAASGRRVAVVSSGDPGIFAMAAAVFEAVEADPATASVDIRVVPGISAMQAAAARVGAPLGHDFAVISLSDNLKPWEVILKRVEAAAGADFVLAFYNPISRHRPWQLGSALEAIGRHRAPGTPVIAARDVGRPDEAIRVESLGALDPATIDMRTILLVGSSTTRLIPGTPWVYTPRSYGASA